VTRLCIALAALALIARARVAVLPGWVVPLPVLLTAALFALCALCALVVAWVALHTPRLRLAPAAPEAAGEAGS
jgi:hypothetical protein